MKSKIKIAIDISPTNDGNATRGVGHYTSNLVSALQKEVKSNPDYQNFQIDLIKNINDLRSNIYDLIHYPYFDPFKLTLPKKTIIPTIVTVHDLIPRQFKTHFPVGLKGELKWQIQKHRLLQVSKIITVSDYSKNIINKITGYSLDNIFVTHLAADSSFQKITDKTKLKEIQKKYNLPSKFILFVGDINWNKNIPTLVKACQNLNYPLVIVGSAATKKNIPNHPWTQDLLWLQKQQNPNLIFTGFVPDKELPYIYNLATIYCQPSIVEGFGLPPLQAAQSGCPVIYGQGSSMDEIIKNAGLKFNPYSQKNLEQKIQKIWNNPKIQQKYANLGLDLAKQFSWKSTALKTLALYNLTLINEK